MADANKLVIELVDTGGEGGRPPTSPGSSADRTEGAPASPAIPLPVVPKIEELVAATKDLVSKMKPTADDWKGVTPELERFRKTEVDPVGAAAYVKLWQDKQAKEGVVTAKRLPGTGPQADATFDDLPVIEPQAKSDPRQGYRVFDRSNAIRPGDLRPVLPQRGPRPVAEVVETKQEREARIANEEAKDRRRNSLLLAGIATQNIAGGGVGQKAAGAVQLAGSGILGSGAAKAAGGNVGAAIQLAGVITDLVDGAIRSVGQGARSGIRTAGDMGTSVARNDGLGAFTKGVDGAADVLAKIPIAGTAAAEALKTFTTVLSTAREVIGAFADRGRELRMYSGPIAQAAAIADVKKLQMDMAEANRFSAQYVKLIEAETRVNAAWRRATDPIRMRIMEFLANRIAPWLERMGERVEGMANKLEMLGVMVDNLDKLAMLDFNGFADEMKKKAKDIDDELKKRNQPVEAGMQAVESWYTALDKLQLPAAMPDPGRDRQLKLPVLLRMGG